MNRLVALAIGLMLTARCECQAPPPEEAHVVPATSGPEWYRAGFFTEFAGEQLMRDLPAEMGGGGTNAVAPLQLTLDSVDLDDFEQRLASDGGLHQRLSLSKDAGAQVVYQLQLTPRWVSSEPNSASPDCADEPSWPRWGTVPPDAAKWEDWEAFVELIVTQLTVVDGYDNLWFQLWEEPNNPCYWSGSEDDYLALYAHTAAAAKRANPDARIGGPGVFDPSAAIAPSATPLASALIAFAESEELPLDFLSYHLFGATPHRARSTAHAFDDALTAAGFADTRLLITSTNPLDSTISQYWPTPPTPSPSGHIWEYDTEIGAAWLPAVAQAMTSAGRHGALTMFQLDDFEGDDEYDTDSGSGWGARTAEERHAIRKAIYQGMRLMAQVPAPTLPVVMNDEAASADGADDPVGAIAGATDGEVVVLLWSYVAAPEKEANAVVVDDGFPAGLSTWDQSELDAFVAGSATAADVTSVPAEQETLEKAKRVFMRQLQLVGRHANVCLQGRGLVRARESVVVDATHNNSHSAWQESGLDAALNAGVLTASADLVQEDGDCWRLTLDPYAVVGLRFEAEETPAELTMTVAQ